MSQDHDRDQTTRPGPGAWTMDGRGLQDFRYRAFISYSHEDKSWADWLIKSLETYRIPPRLVGTQTPVGKIPRRLSPVFRDRDELASASDLGDTIREALADSATLIVICSPASANSHWVNEEILAFQQLGRGDRILCLIVDGIPNATDLPGQAYKECFAPALRRSGSGGDSLRAHHTEPIAPDAREEAGGRNVARLKLIAGLLGVGFDVLKRRHQQRRMRRMAAVTALARVVTLMTTTLAITAIIARHNAEIARQAAERRQKQAEGLINFMLGDLNDKLTEVGRLDIMQSVDDRAMAYFASLPVADVTDQSLVLRATALQKIGLVRRDQGHLDKALKSFLLANEISKSLLRKSPDDASRLANYGRSQNYLGYAYWRMEKPVLADRYFRSAIQTLERALAARPDDWDSKAALADTLNNLAQLTLSQHDPARTTTYYRRQIALYKQLLKHDPENGTYAFNLMVSANNVAGFERSRGHLLRSIRGYADAWNNISDAAVRNPRDRKLTYLLMILTGNIAASLHEAGLDTQAMQAIRHTEELGTRLVRIDPTNTEWKVLLSAYTIWQARWVVQSHPHSLKAYRNLQAQTRRLASLLKANPKDSPTRRSLALARLSLADADMASGRTAMARQHALAVLETLGPLSQPDASNARSVRMACMAHLLLGHSDPSRQSNHLARALALIGPVASHSSNPRDLMPWTAALLASGKRDKALAVVQRLHAMGYRPVALTTLLSRWHIDYKPDPAYQSRIDAILASTHVSSTDQVTTPSSRVTPPAVTGTDSPPTAQEKHHVR